MHLGNSPVDMVGQIVPGHRKLLPVGTVFGIRRISGLGARGMLVFKILGALAMQIL